MTAPDGAVGAPGDLSAEERARALRLLAEGGAVTFYERVQLGAHLPEELQRIAVEKVVRNVRAEAEAIPPEQLAGATGEITVSRIEMVWSDPAEEDDGVSRLRPARAGEEPDVIEVLAEATVRRPDPGTAPPLWGRQAF